MSTGISVGYKEPNRSKRRETPKGRGMLKNLIIKWADAIHRNEIKGIEAISIDEGPSINSERGITFNVYKASGGTVIETRFYDDVKDRHRRGLYVITDEHDMGHELAKIITMESLKQ
jgi:hypothetical protein